MKTQVESCLSIDINTLNQKGALGHGCGGTISWSGGSEISILVYERQPDYELVVQLSFTGNQGDVKQIIPIIYTVPNYGGKRPWFGCNLYCNGIYCGRRVGKLYLPPGCKYFACRHCYDLTYQSRQEWTNPKTKALIKSLDLMQEMDRISASRKSTKTKFERILQINAELYTQMRKAGIANDVFPKED